ncbi:unnamed protein product [Protopolystoma xenopodis]|uniref:Uncharacterized protein n=1 Tax=Protopolystoma xenopodis TaxID=117903 RepID=A0A3S5B3Z3_9PLAT|nr:unnamed protein product [Protopolystoma xenopodis]
MNQRMSFRPHSSSSRFFQSLPLAPWDPSLSCLIQRFLSSAATVSMLLEASSSTFCLKPLIARLFQPH